MESNQNERSKPWNGMPQTPTSGVTGHKPQIWGNRMSNRARGKQTSNAANAQATHTAEVILVALATEEALMNQLRPWLNWLESRGIYPSSIELSLADPTVGDALPNPEGPTKALEKEAAPSPVENGTKTELDLFRTGRYSDWGINE